MRQPIRDRFKFAFLALATVFLCRSVDYGANLVAFFREGLGYTERAGAERRWLATARHRMLLILGRLRPLQASYLTALKFPTTKSRTVAKDNISMADVYVGVLPLILSLLALWQRPRISLAMVAGWNYRFFPACAVGDRLPVRGWLYDYCPPTRYFAYPAMFRGYAIFRQPC